MIILFHYCYPGLLSSFTKAIKHFEPSKELLQYCNASKFNDRSTLLMNTNTY